MLVKDNFIEILIISLTFLILAYSSDPVFYSDSSRYLGGSLIDPPLYSTVISIMKSIFTTLNSVIILQTFFISFGILFFTKTISKYFDVDIKSKLVICSDNRIL